MGFFSFFQIFYSNINSKHPKKDLEQQSLIKNCPKKKKTFQPRIDIY
jgi:hypothetical protein